MCYFHHCIHDNKADHHNRTYLLETYLSSLVKLLDNVGESKNVIQLVYKMFMIPNRTERSSHAHL